MLKKIKIRKMEQDDLEPAYKLGLDQFRGEAWFTRKFLKNTAEPPGYDFVALDREKIVGAIMVENLDRPKNWIFFFVVKRNIEERELVQGFCLPWKKVFQKSTRFFLLILGQKTRRQRIFTKKTGLSKGRKLKTGLMWASRDLFIQRGYFEISHF